MVSSRGGGPSRTPERFTPWPRPVGHVLCVAPGNRSSLSSRGRPHAYVVAIASIEDSCRSLLSASLSAPSCDVCPGIVLCIAMSRVLVIVVWADILFPDLGAEPCTHARGSRTEATPLDPITPSNPLWRLGQAGIDADALAVVIEVIVHRIERRDDALSCSCLEHARVAERSCALEAAWRRITPFRAWETCVSSYSLDSSARDGPSEFHRMLGRRPSAFLGRPLVGLSGCRLGSRSVS